MLISLYDNVPKVAIGVMSKISYGGLFGEYSTAEEAATAKHEKIASYTKNEILTLKNSNVKFILLRPEDTSYDETWYSLTTGEKILEFDGSPYVKEIYGSIEEPTYGKMYSLNNESLEKIITEEIYSDVAETIGTSMDNVVVKEYFSKEIIDNFTISVSEKYKDNVDTTKLLTDGYIIWNAGKIETESDKVLEYSIKIKDMKNKDILNKTVSTNEKANIEYNNYLEQKVSETLSSSPKIKLSEIKEELTATVTYDHTETTSGPVTATIKTNKEVKNVEGWSLSENGMILTKKYYKNMIETVHLIDIDGMEKEVNINISNIKENTISNENTSTSNDDETISDRILPKTGISQIILITIIVIGIIGIFAFYKIKLYQDVK